MRELVIVVSDFYLPHGSPAAELPSDLPGIRHALRFGTQSALPRGWRSWLARWLNDGGEKRSGAGDRDAHAPDQTAPATMAAISQLPLLPHPAPGAVFTDDRIGAEEAHIAAGAAPVAIGDAPIAAGDAPIPAGDARIGAGAVWIATPVHLLAGMTGVHLDHRGLLRLDPDDSGRLASDFERVFHDSAFHLRPLQSGEFLLFGPDIPTGARPEPARVSGGPVADTPHSDGAEHRALRRLSTEVEMWLHDHPVNEARRRRGELPVTGLWFWGGGRSPVSEPVHTRPAMTESIAFGVDSFLQGLWASAGAKVLPLPQHATELFSYSHAQRAALVLELGPMLHSNPTWTLYDALSRVDRDFVSPAVEALTVRRLETLMLLANDRQITLRSRDRFKLWRRARPGLTGLQ